MKRMGFTLIEIIVVVSIISLLTSLVVPLLASARKKAQSTLCRSNLRQMGMEFALYNETNNAFPSALTPANLVPYALRNTGDGSIDWIGIIWFYDLNIPVNNFAHEKSIMQCPSKNLTEKFKYNILWGNYGVNWSVCRSPEMLLHSQFSEFAGLLPMRPTSLKKPSKTLLVADSGYSLMTWLHTLPDSHPRSPKTSYEAFNHAYIPGASVNTQKTLWPVQEEDALNGRHPGKTVNCLFTDGHVDNKKADDLVVKPLDHGQFENLVPLWKP